MYLAVQESGSLRCIFLFLVSTVGTDLVAGILSRPCHVYLLQSTDNQMEILTISQIARYQTCEDICTTASDLIYLQVWHQH